MNQMSIIARLGTAQTLAWASSYYLLAILADPIANDLGISSATVFGAFSVALLLSAFLGPFAGRAVDHHGGRPVLAATNLIFALGLLVLSGADSAVSVIMAWLLIGVGMSAGLYETAFASLVRLYGHAARGPITGITLIAGFASTLGWSLSVWMTAHFGWRGTCMGWAGLHLLLALPLNLSLPNKKHTVPLPAQAKEARASPPQNTLLPVILLSIVFALGWFISTAMAAHLPQLLVLAGLSTSGAVAVAALIGPAQVAARFAEFGMLRYSYPLLSARLAALAHPLGAVILLIFGGSAALPFVLLHGAGNGILTIANGTLPLAIFGTAEYGLQQGILMALARIAQALAPYLFGLAVTAWGDRALWLSAALGMIAFGALLALRKPVAA